MKRGFIKRAVCLPLLGLSDHAPINLATSSPSVTPPFRRVRPGDAGWPTNEQWEQLRRSVDGQLAKLESPFETCRGAARECESIIESLKNPYHIGDSPELTQTSGWLNAWTSKPSAYVVMARNARHVVEAVNFARHHNMRLVIKGGGHSYQGTSNAADSLLIWTKQMNEIELHDDFTPEGCENSMAPQQAVSIGAGAIWLQVYNSVTTQGGRYVQGGGCTTVGVAGLIQSGGFGSFSKNYGLASAGLLEAEVVTANGQVLLTNECKHPDLFWALKGGGGGSFGVVTSLTLRTRQLPNYFGGAFGRLKASSGEAFAKLISRFLNFYKTNLLGPYWGEQVRLHPDNSFSIQMVFQGIDQRVARQQWESFIDFVDGAKGELVWENELTILHVPAQRLWDATFYKEHAPEHISIDNRPSAPATNYYWRGDGGEAGQFLHGYDSVWLPGDLLSDSTGSMLATALYRASRHYTVSLHFNKGLAGASEPEKESARKTAINPAAIDAFALAIVAGGSGPAFPDIKGFQPDLSSARSNAVRIELAMKELRKVVKAPGSYVSESNYFEKEWQKSFWGDNYDRLKKVKDRYDPECLFFVRHGVGSEEWSEDGFTKS